jgi:hypothetical protein
MRACALVACACVHACACVCVRACVHVCACERVCACGLYARALASAHVRECLCMLHSCTKPLCTAGDILLFMTVLASVHRPWVAQLLVPYVVCFGVANLAALVSIMSKSAASHSAEPSSLSQCRPFPARSVICLAAPMPGSGMPALVMLTFLIGKFRGQHRRAGLSLNDEERILEDALHANRFAAR